MTDIGKASRPFEPATTESPGAASAGAAPGRATLVQRKEGGPSEVSDPGAVQAAASAGVAGGGARLPHLDRIQQAFGPQHDVSGIQAHVGGAAASASEQIGARAYATGNSVAFKEQPDLHLAAHEAAHVVQQKGGVSLKGGVGAANDAHEQHADAVADRVVAGQSAADLLSAHAGGGSGSATTAVQRDGTARALAANERVLSKDPAYTADGYVTWFANQARAKLDAWDLPFDATSVKAATVNLDGADVKVILITWNPAWGGLPITRDFPLSMAPLDAKAGNSASHALAGWQKLTGAERTTIGALLEGEENALSRQVRDHFRPTFKALKTRPDTDQATALKGLTNSATTAPGWQPESMDHAFATVAVTGPVDKPAFAFAGGAADAEEWTATFSDGIAIKIYSPKAPTAGYHNHTVQEVAEAATHMPKSARQVITQIVLNTVTNPQDAHWAVEYHKPDFHSYMTAGAAGVVTIYPDKATNALPGDDGRRSAMVHETGHTWSYRTWGNDTTKGGWTRWQAAMTSDGVAVSGYATNAIAEDVAETIRVYVSAKGKPREAEYAAIVPARWAILKAEYDK